MQDRKKADSRGASKSRQWVPTDAESSIVDVEVELPTHLEKKRTKRRRAADLKAEAHRSGKQISQSFSERPTSPASAASAPAPGPHKKAKGLAASQRFKVQRADNAI